MVAFALPALADIAPVITWPVDVTRPEPYPLTLRQGETVILQPTYNQDLTGTDAVVLKRRLVGGATVYATTGSVYSATGGVARIRLDVTDAIAVYQYEIAITSSNAILLRSYGTLKVIDSMAGEIPATPPSGTGDTLAPSEPEGSYPNDIAPVLTLMVDPTELVPHNITLRQGETVIIQATFAGTDFSGAAAVALRYRPVGSSGWHYVAPGTIHDATGGVARVRWDSTIEGTNSVYQYEILAQSSSATLNRCYGLIKVDPSLSGSSTSMPTRVTAFDWAAVDHQNIGSAPFLSIVSLAPFASFWASLTNGTADLSVGSLLVNGQPVGSGGGVGNYTNTEIAGVANTNSVRIGNGSNLTWHLRGGVWYPDVPILVGPQGERGLPGTAVTNVTVQTNLTLTSVIITNLTIQQGTNVTIYYATDDSRWSTNQPFVSAFVWTNAGENATVTNAGVITAVINTNSGSGGLAAMPATWDADSIGTNQLGVKVGGMQQVQFTTNGIVITHGSLQLYESDLWCNVRLYDGSRLAPSLTFYGHPDDWGLYARGYGGKYVAGWSVGGTEIGLLAQTGIKLMSTNYTFDGTVVGDLSGCWGYPEPVFESWKTNMSFSSLVLSNLVVTPGGIQIKDSLNVNRIVLGTTGITVYDSGAISRAVLGTDLTIKDTLGRTISKTDAAFTYYDAASGMAMVTVGGVSYQDGFGIKWTSGNTVIDLGAVNGLRMWDPYQNRLNAKMNYQGIELYGATSNTIFKVDTTGSPWNTIVNNLVITNSGTIKLYGGTGGSNLITTITFLTNGVIQAFGRDIYRTNWPSVNSTNISIGGKTNVYQMQNGTITNIIVL